MPFNTIETIIHESFPVKLKFLTAFENRYSSLSQNIILQYSSVSTFSDTPIPGSLLTLTLMVTLFHVLL